MELPFIHLLKTPLNYYVYDVNTNQIIAISSNTYNYLEKWLVYKNISDSPSDEIKDLVSKGYLSPNRPKKIEHPASSIIRSRVENFMEELVLQVTQQCNFRCSYCHFVEHEFDVYRTHASRNMSFDIAKAAIDFYVEHSKGMDKAAIAFYGGEPLLRFNLIKQVVEYTKRKLEGKEIRYITTINGSLLSADIIDFMVENNFELTISLDGDKETHNRSRKFAFNGKGTYDSIIANIRSLRQIYPEYYKKHVLFNVVLDSGRKCAQVFDFFMKQKDIGKANVRSSIVEMDHEIEKATISDDFLIDYGIQEFKAYLTKMGRYPEENLSPLASQILQQNIETLPQMVAYDQLPETMSPSGPCVPGQKRLFVDVNGNLFPCEKINETSTATKIGNLKTGFDWKRVYQLLNIGQMTETRCKQCWAFRHCTMCVRTCDNNRELSTELKKSKCHGIHQQTERKFYNYLLFRELFGMEETV